MLSHRLETYNQQLDMVDRLEASGQAIVIRPVQPVVVGRMEKDVKKLEDLYEEGFEQGELFVKQNIK